jgi:hypothetical protein
MTLDPVIKKAVIVQYLSGNSRDKIAADNGIGQGTVSNIIADFKKGVQDSDFSSVRELAVYCKKGDTNLADLTSALRIKNYINGLGIAEERLEQFVARCTNSQDPQKLVDVLEKIGNIGLDVPLEELEEHINIRRAEKDALEAEKEILQKEIEEERKTLKELKKMAEDFLMAKGEMNKCGISGSDPSRFLNVIRTFQKYKYDCSKIINAFTEALEVVDIKRLKEETDQQQNFINIKLEELGLGDFSQLKQVVISLMTLESMGMSLDQIVGLARNLHPRST